MGAIPFGYNSTSTSKGRNSFLKLLYIYTGKSYIIYAPQKIALWMVVCVSWELS